MEKQVSIRSRALNLCTMYGILCMFLPLEGSCGCKGADDKTAVLCGRNTFREIKLKTD